MRHLALAFALTPVLACASNEKPAASPVQEASPVEPAVGPVDACPKVDGETVTVTTADGVDLIADHYTTGTTGSPVAVLLHMIPPHHDKSNYTAVFIDALRAAGYDVLNLNRRGAPGSKGDAVAAYEGDAGKLDAVAGVRHVLDHPCKADPEHLVMVGASNGTTTVADYTVHAHSDEGLPVPRALVFLSGGSYTENQHALAEHRVILDPVPIYFAYPTAEAEWNLAVREDASPEWTFKEFSPGSHGTKLFGSDPAIISALVTWLGSL